MSPLRFGDDVPCRPCHGTGLLERNPELGDREAARERSRQRRHGQTVDPPPRQTTCRTCSGTGVVARAVADRPNTPPNPPNGLGLTGE